MAKSRLEELYTKTIRSKLQKDLDLANIMQVPRISKVVLNVGVKEAVGDARALEAVIKILKEVSGQTPVKTVARKSIAGFKIREGMPLGVMVTLRRARMYEFLDKLINLALPKVRDFHGVPTKLDGRGNYNLGIREMTIFPEIDSAAGEKVSGMNITIQTTTVHDEHGRALLSNLGMPFIKK